MQMLNVSYIVVPIYYATSG